jgi:DNA repair photolyase
MKKGGTLEEWHNENLDLSEIERVENKKPSKVMFPSVHDITPTNIHYCIDSIKRILDAGHQLLIVSKPHLDCIKEICWAFSSMKDKILFRFTIGSTSNEILSFWENGAPCFEERLSCLKKAYELGFRTSVSSEPMLDDNVEDIVNKCLPYVNDALWIGKPNFLKERLTDNHASEKHFERAEELMSHLNDERIWEIYNKFQMNPLVKWKESIKKIVGIEVPTKAGLDV